MPAKITIRLTRKQVDALLTAAREGLASAKFAIDEGDPFLRWSEIRAGERATERIRAALLKANAQTENGAIHDAR